VDAVLPTTSTTSDDPIDLAAQRARVRARVVVVGIVGMHHPHNDYYRKELELRLSRSYGPGRYDTNYEERGIDYPIGYVRWTEQRNMAAFLDLLSNGSVQIGRLITHRFRFDQAVEAYQVVSAAETSRAIGVVFDYGVSAPPAPPARTEHAPWVPPRVGSTQKVRIGVIGAGSFARSTLLPVLRGAPDVELVAVATATPLSARYTAERFGFRYHTCDHAAILDDPGIDAVIVATRHNLHAELACAALDHGKAVFVEKPLALSVEELRRVVDVKRRTGGRLLVGFNRRFSDMAVNAREFLAASAAPKMMLYRVNAGYLPADHWYHDPEQGGGRLLGEACHFLDFFHFLAGAPPVRVQGSAMDNAGRYVDDNFALTVEFADGSVGALTYTACGDRSLPKERVEVFSGEATAILDDFRVLTLSRAGKSHRRRTRFGQDKGHAAELRAFLSHVDISSPEVVPFDELVASSLATLAAHRAMQTRAIVPIDPTALEAPGER